MEVEVMQENKKNNMRVLKEEKLEKVTGGVEDYEGQEEQEEPLVQEWDHNPGRIGLIASDYHKDVGSHLN